MTAASLAPVHVQLIEQVVRSRVCSRCFKRPAGSDSLEPTIARNCQPGCAVFRNLEAVGRVVAELEADPNADYDKHVRKSVCQRCTVSATAGPLCHRRTNRSCPLSVYAERVGIALEPLVLRHCGSD